MIRFLIQPMLDAAYARGYQAGMNDALDEADRRRAEVMDSVWGVIDNAAPAPPLPNRFSNDRVGTNVVAIHLRRADGKFHL